MQCKHLWHCCAVPCPAAARERHLPSTYAAAECRRRFLLTNSQPRSPVIVLLQKMNILSESRNLSCFPKCPVGGFLAWQFPALTEEKPGCRRGLYRSSLGPATSAKEKPRDVAGLRSELISCRGFDPVISRQITQPTRPQSCRNRQRTWQFPARSCPVVLVLDREHGLDPLAMDLGQHAFDIVDPGAPGHIVGIVTGLIQVLEVETDDPPLEAS